MEEPDLDAARVSSERQKKGKRRALWKNEYLTRKQNNIVASRIMRKRREWKRLRYASFHEEDSCGDNVILLNPPADVDGDWIHVHSQKKEETLSILKYFWNAKRWIRSVMVGYTR